MIFIGPFSVYKLIRLENATINSDPRDPQI